MVDDSWLPSGKLTIPDKKTIILGSGTHQFFDGKKRPFYLMLVG